MGVHTAVPGQADVPALLIYTIPGADPMLGTGSLYYDIRYYSLCALRSSMYGP